MVQSNASGGRSRTGAAGRGAAIVDVVQRRHSDRVAKVAFIAVWAVLTPTTVVVASAMTNLLLAAAVGLVGGLAVAAVTYVVVLVWPAIRLVWYWIGEITALMLLLAAYLGLTRLLPWPAALLILCSTVGTLLLIPASRRGLSRWVWCAISRHRLRTCFATFVRANRYGSLPWILLARPTRAGERVWVWLRPGLSLSDLQTEGGLDRLGAGCWAAQVKVSRTRRRNSALLRVDITRRNPLAGTVTSPLTRLIPATATELLQPSGIDPAAVRPPRVTAPVDMATLDLPGVPDTPPADTPPPAGNSPGARTRPPTPRRPATAPSPAQQPVITRTADDLSEWV